MRFRIAGRNAASHAARPSRSPAIRLAPPTHRSILPVTQTVSAVRLVRQPYRLPATPNVIPPRRATRGGGRDDIRLGLPVLVHSIEFIRHRRLYIVTPQLIDGRDGGREGDCDIQIFVILLYSPRKRDQARLANLTLGVICVNAHSGHGRDIISHE